MKNSPTRSRSTRLRKARLWPKCRPAVLREKAGLKSGDVVTSVDDKKIDGPRELQLMIGSLAPGTKVNLKVLRDGQEQLVQVELGERPGQRGVAQAEPADTDPDVLDGVTVSDIDAEARKEFEIGENIKGVIITQVDPDSPSAAAGLKRGDIIHEVNREAVTDAKQAVELSEKLKKEKKVLLRVSSRGTSRFVSWNGSSPSPIKSQAAPGKPGRRFFLASSLSRPEAERHRNANTSLLLLLAASSVCSLAADAAGTFHGTAGLQLYSLREAFKTDVPGTLDKVKALGVKEVETASTYNMTPEAFRKELQLGSYADQRQFQYDALTKDLAGSVRDAKALGLKYVACPWIPHTIAEFSEADVKRGGRRFQQMGRGLQEGGYHLRVSSARV